MPRRDLSISMHERRCTYWNAGAMFKDEFHFFIQLFKIYSLRATFERNLYTCFHRNNFFKTVRNL